MAKILIAFFSMTGETHADGEIIKLEKGFTQMAAEYVHEAVGGDLFHIRRIRKYSEDHDTMLNEAKAEIQNKETPKLKEYLDSIEKYDIIFLAYPNWWYSLPGPVATFLTHYNFRGKKIIPLNTSGGGGFADSYDEIEMLARGAQIARGMTIPGAKVERKEQEIKDWAKAQV